MAPQPNSTNRPIRGLLLINVGTPDGPTPGQVKKYLKEFLMDPRVIDIPYPIRWVLVNLLIVPKRAVTSAEAYSKIWTEKGAPLLINLVELTYKVHEALGPDWMVRGAMRYQTPSISHALFEFKQSGIEEIVVLPIYPQYSLAATESSIEKCKSWVSRNAPSMRLKFIADFFDFPEFIDAFVAVARQSLSDFRFDHLLFSFHGLPERQIKKLGPSENAHCQFSEACCEKIGEQNKKCYRAQCFRTAELIAQQLSLAPSQYTVCFQSRLGNTPWIQPFTDELYKTLPKKGIKRLAVMCPAFTSDCLETLEEVAIRGKADFIFHGGEELKLVPSLNTSSEWVSAVCSLAKKQADSV